MTSDSKDASYGGGEAGQAGGPQGAEAAASRPYDPERGLRGVMSAILVLEAVTLLLGLTVLANGGRSAPAWELVTVTALAFAHLLTPALIKRRWIVAVIFALQLLVIGCWVIHGAIGAIGVIFLMVWIGVMYMRQEFRRRVAAGTIAGAAVADPQGPISEPETNEEHHQ